MQNAAGYAVAAIGILTLGAVVIFADPDNAGKWAPLIIGLVAGLPGLVAVFQNDAAKSKIENHDAKLERVSHDINGIATAAKNDAAEAAYNRGKLETIEDLRTEVRRVMAREYPPTAEGNADAHLE